jgi:succinate dehydrogenase/fumarate reductase flavoprotein subunit
MRNTGDGWTAEVESGKRNVEDRLRFARWLEHRCAVRRCELPGGAQPRNGRMPEHRRKAQPRRNGDHLCGDLNDQHERDQGAEPNKLVKVTDLLSATTLPTADGDHDRDDRIGHFVTIHSAKVGEVSRGAALAPKDHDDNDDQL